MLNSKITRSIKVIVACTKANRAYPPSREIDDQVLVASPLFPILHDLTPPRVNQRAFQVFSTYQPLHLPHKAEPSN